MLRSHMSVAQFLLAVLAGIAILAAIACWAVPVRAQEDRWASPPHVREWFETLMQPDQPTVRCCGESDAYWADSFETSGNQYVAIITDERPPCSETVVPPECVMYRPHIPPGTKVLVPNHKLKFDKGNPTGHGVLFVTPQLVVLCYVAPGGG